MLIPLETFSGMAVWPETRYLDGGWFAGQSRSRADVLLQHDVLPADRVLIVHGGSRDFFADLFAVWRVGACAVCTNPGLTAEELENICAFVSPKVVLAADAFSPSPMPSTPVLHQQAGHQNGEAAPLADITDCGGCLDDDALMLFTSGTTGVPKGVVHTFRSLIARIALNISHIGERAMERSLCVLPTHFGHGLIGNCLTPLFAGQHLLLAPGGNLDVIGSLGKIIDEHRVTFLSSVPSFWKKVLKSTSPPTKGSVKRVHIGSAPLSAELWKEVCDWSGTRETYNMYGITETANWLAGATLEEADGADGVVGTVWGGTAAVLTDAGEIAAQGRGEVLVQTPSLMKGYFNRPDLTRRVLRDGWFRTGDIGELGDDGSLRLVGRQKYEINRGGLKVHPEDIDIMLERHEAVREACAFSMPHEIEGETVAVAVSLLDGYGLTAKDLRKWSARRLVREKLPEHWFIVDEIPKTDRGKLNRRRVAEFCLNLLPK